jgi:Flp pilus assembly pilin Flp
VPYPPPPKASKRDCQQAVSCWLCFACARSAGARLLSLSCPGAPPDEDREGRPKFLTGREEAATLAEYGLQLALIAVVSITAIAAIGGRTSTMFSTLSTSI